MSDRRFTRSNIDETIDLVYNFVTDYIDTKGYPPSVRDICVGVGIHSTSTIHGHLKRLNETGRIAYTPGKRRAITVQSRQAFFVLHDVKLTASCKLIRMIIATTSYCTIDMFQTIIELRL